MQLPSSTYDQNVGTAATLAHRPDLDPRNSLLVSGQDPKYRGGEIHSKGGAYGVPHHGANNFSRQQAKQLPKIYLLPAIAHPEPPTRSSFDPELAPSLPSTSGPIKLVRSILATWKLQPKDALPLLGYEASQWSHVQRLLDGHGVLSGRDVKDRIACLFEIRRTLSGLFRDQEVENDWLRESHSILNDRKPLDLLLEGSIENLLLVKDYVELAAGR